MKDERKTKEQLINELVELRQRIAELEGSEAERKWAEGAIQWSRIIWLPAIGMFFLLCILVWLNEILDLPHLLLGAPRTPMNWQEAIIETILIVAIGLFTVSKLIYDITERKRAEEALRESEDRYRDLVEHSHDLICTHDLEGQILSVNQGAAKLLGYDRSVLLKRNIRDILAAEVRDEFDTYLATIRRHGVASGLMLVQTSTGERRIWEYNNTLRTEGVAAPIVRGMAHDITVRKQAEKALRESEERYRSLFEGAEDHIFVVGQDFRYVIVNASALKAGGFTLEDVVGKGPNELFPKDAEFYLSQYRHAFETGEPVRFERVLRLPDGLHWFSVTLSPIKDTRGRVIALTGISRDITERKRAEEALELRAEQLTALSQASQAVTTSLELDQVLAEIVSLASEVSAADYTSVVLVDEAGNIGQSAENVPGVPAIEYRIRDEGLTSWIVRSGQAAVIDGIGQDGAINPDLGAGAPCFANPLIVEAGVKSFAGLPLMVKDRLLGVLYLHSLRPAAFHGQLPLLNAFANQAAIAIENARLHEAVQRELDERKRAGEALRRSEEAHRLLFEQSADGIIIIAKGRIAKANQAFCAIYGLPVERIVGRSPLDLLHPEDRNIAARRIEALRSGEPVSESHVYCGLREDGSVFWVEVRSKRIEWEGERAIQSIVRDITERKRAEEEIRRLNQFLDSVIDNANVWLNVLDEKANVVIWNKAAEEISGYSREEVVGHGKIWEWLYPDEEYRDEILAGALAIIEEGREEEDAETTIRRKDGQTRVISWNSRSLVDEKGAPMGSIALGRDITERKQLEAQLRQAQKMTAIGQLAGGIAHDFNNLLTPISGFAELLLWKAPEDSQQQEYLHQIKTAAERAAALTHQLRLFTRQAGGERRSVQLNSVVEETRDLLERSLPREITIELRLASDLWAVEADPSQISQVLMNLCVNARDAMPDGGTLTLETRNMTLDEEWAQAILEAQPGRYVCLTVSDTGCGMSPEVQARLFEPFFTTKGVGEGTGLGLAVVYGIVKRHGGFINVYSQEGQGSTLHVYLPAIEWAVEDREVEGLELPTGTGTILVVDDEEMVRALGQRVLELCGYTVLMAEDGVQALEVYQAHQGEIALVVLDVIMPQMGGLECLRHLRALDPRVKVLISTGYTARSLAQELVAEGALGVVEKPFQIRDFAVAVRMVLGKS